MDGSTCVTCPAVTSEGLVVVVVKGGGGSQDAALSPKGTGLTMEGWGFKK